MVAPLGNITNPEGKEEQNEQSGTVQKVGGVIPSIIEQALEKLGEKSPTASNVADVNPNNQNLAISNTTELDNGGQQPEVPNKSQQDTGQSR